MVATDITAARATSSADLLQRLGDSLNAVIRCKKDTIDLLLCAVAASGHVLLEDVPGTGKTTLAKALALSIGGVFKRVQFTPDLLPTDIVGASIYQQSDGTFRFKRGPIFANVLIADEINRASPRTQSALLEALSEGQVTVDGETHVLEQPFLCIATQNPVDFHGTYPLPEAQLDRFAAQLSLGYPSPADELAILAAQRGRPPVADVKAVCSAADIIALQRAAETVTIEDSVSQYLLAVVHATRGHASVRLGASTRGALILSRMARARALMHGRDFVLPEDVKTLAPVVLAHRLVLDARARYAGQDKRALTHELLASVPVPL